MLAGQGIGAKFRRTGEVFHLEKGVSAIVFERVAPLDDGTSPRCRRDGERRARRSASSARANVNGADRMSTYDSAFFEYINEGSASSAAAIIPL